MADRTALAAALLLLPLSLVRAGGGSPAPLTIAVEVAFGHQQGEESLREALELRFVRELRRESCFREAVVAGEDGAAADVLLRVLITDTEEQSDYDLSLSQRDSPDRMQAEPLQMVARMKISLELQLLLLPGNQTLRERGLTKGSQYRPKMQEDPEYEVRLRLIDSLARSVRKFACGKGLKKLHKEIERARGES